MIYNEWDGDVQLNIRRKIRHSLISQAWCPDRGQEGSLAVEGNGYFTSVEDNFLYSVLPKVSIASNVCLRKGDSIIDRGTNAPGF